MTTVQITLNEDDIEALERLIRQHSWNDPDLVSIATHIIEQVNLKQGALACTQQ